MTQLKDSLGEKSAGGDTSTKKEGTSKKIFLAIVVVLVLINLLVATGVVLYLVNKSEDETAEESTEEESEVEWKTYTNEEYGFEFQYPSDWELQEGYCTEEGCSSIIVTKDGYVWRVVMDPIYSTGGWGYIFDVFIPPSSVEYSEVSPAGYSSDMVAYYYSDTKVASNFEEDSMNWNLGSRAWGNSVLFRKAEPTTGLDIDIPGFGPGDTYNEEEGDYFSIVYEYDSQKDDYSDLPQKDDEKLLEMLVTMDQITNSFEIIPETQEVKKGTVSDSSTKAGWKLYENEEYGFSFEYPSDWGELSEEGSPYSVNCLENCSEDECDCGMGFIVSIEKDDWIYKLAYNSYWDDVTGSKMGYAKVIEIFNKDRVRSGYLDWDQPEFIKFFQIVETERYDIHKPSEGEDFGQWEGIGIVLGEDSGFMITYTPEENVTYSESEDIINEMDQISETLELM